MPVTGRFATRAVVLACAGIVLAGCARGYTVGFDGVSEEQIRQDWGLCGGNFSRRGGKWIPAGDEDRVFGCMRDRGYSIGVTLPVLDPRLPPIPLISD
jgi:hypothetical protein